MSSLEEDLAEVATLCLGYPVATTEEPSWALECVRVLDKDFCLVKRTSSGYGGFSTLYDIMVSPTFYRDVVRDINESYKSDKTGTSAHYDLNKLKSVIREASTQCRAVISCLKNQRSDERKKVEEQILLQEDIRRHGRY